MIVLLPAMLEVIDGELLMVTIPDFPLTLGRLSFVLSGLILIFNDWGTNFKLKSMIGFLLVFIGQFLASLLFGSEDALTKSIAFLLLFAGSIGNANLLRRKWGRMLIDGFFIALFLYWSVKSLGRTILHGYSSYSDMFIAGDVINHHVPGMLISISASYLAVRFFYRDSRLRIMGYLLFFITLVICLIIESRSNFLVSLLVLSYLVLQNGVRKMKHAVMILPVLLTFFMVINIIIKRNETLNKRFTFSDVEYQEKTSGMRVEYLKIGVENFISNPLGKGALDTQVKYKGRSLSIHNQFLTFIVSGGLVTLLGLIILTIGLIKVFRNFTRNLEHQTEIWNKYVFASALACLTFFFTLLFIEMSGLLLFLMISVLLFIEKEMSTINRESE